MAVTPNASPGPRHQRKGEVEDETTRTHRFQPPSVLYRGSQRLLDNHLKSILNSLILALNKLAQPLLHSLPALISVPNMVRRLVDHIPRNKVIRQLRKIFLLTTPLLVSAHRDSRADNHKRRTSVLDRASRRHFVLRQAIRYQVLLQRRFDELATLRRFLAIHAVFARAALEQRTADAVDAERRDDAPGPEQEAGAGRCNAVQEVFVQRVDEHDADDVAAVAGAENARDDAAVSGRDEYPGTLLTGDGECFGQVVGAHAGAVGRGGVVGPAVAWAVPVAVAGDGAVLVGGVCPVFEVEFQWLLRGFEEDGGRASAIGSFGFADAGQVYLVLVAVDEVAIAVHFQACIAGAENQSGGHEDGDGNVDGQDDSGGKHGEPLSQSAARLRTASETLLFLAFAPGDHPISNDAETSDQSSPDNAGNTRRSFFCTNAWDADNDDEIYQEEEREHALAYLHSLGRSGEEEERA